MKKVQAETLGSIADYRVIEVDRPAPGPGEVLIKVRACGMGYVDALVALGRYQVKPPVPFTPGQEFSGVIAEIGEGVTGLSPGDRVMATFAGGLSEFVRVPARSVTAIPDAMRFEQAAGFAINYLTALHGLRDRARLERGERLVVLGAAGGVGSAAVQLGGLFGAEVTAVCSSPEKRAFAASLGAHATLDTEKEGWRDRLKETLGGKGPDVVFDPVCGPLFELAFRSLSWRGRHLVVGFAGGPIPALPVNLPLMKGAALVGVDVRQFLLFEAERAAAHMAELLDMVAQERLVPPVGRTFAFSEYGEAMEFALSGKGLAKTVISLD